MAEETLTQFSEEIQKHFVNQTYTEGLVLATQALKKFPDDFSLINYWRICLAARLEAYNEANQMLEAALASGVWYSEMLLRQSPSLAPLQENPEFERLVEIALKMRAADPAEKIPLLVLRPEDACGPDDEKGCPLLLFLHANQDTAQNNLPHWKDLSTQGWLVAMPQSKSVMWAGAYAWTDHDTAAAEIKAHHAKLAEQYSLDPEQIILAGFSMGAEVALALALSGVVKTHGFMLLGPGGPYMDEIEKWEPLIAEAQGKELRGVIWMGEADDSIPRDNVILLAEMLNDGGIPTELKTFPDLAHEYPPNFEKELAEALKYIIG
jgi:predicted esterase